MPDLPVVNDTVISRIAREVARDIYPIQHIRESNKLSMEDWDNLLQSEIFKQRFSEELAVWNASDPMSIVQRIRTKASTMVEESLIEAFELIHDKSQPMAAKIEALKWASRMAGIDVNPSVKGGGPGDDAKIKITINIGNTKVEFDKERALPSQVIEGDAVELTPSTVA